jgi:predicted amidohydrolase
LRVAAIQLSPVIGELEENRARAARAVEEAASRGAKLVVLPELCVSGYVFADLDEALASSEPLTGETVKSWQSLAARHRLTIVGGICEQHDSGALHNAAVVVEGAGLVAVHRKTHLWDREQLVFTPGSQRSPVVETASGRIGVAICYDSFFPEVMRGLALGGAEVIVVPMNSPATDPPFEPLPIEVSLVIASAAVNRVFVIQADRTGRERGVDWAEASVIVDPDGRLLAGPATGSAVLVADLDLEQARDKSYGDRNDVLADRRVDLYETRLRTAAASQ